MNIVLAPCSYRYLDKRTAWGIGKLLACPDPNYKFTQTEYEGDAAIDRARSIVGTEFLRHGGYDVLLYIDDDIVFHPLDALKLFKHIENGKHIVCGAYVTKSSIPQLACRLYDGQKIEFNVKAEPVRIVYAAGGFTAITKKVFERMSTKIPLCFAGSKGDRSFWPFFLPMIKRVSRKIIGQDEWEYLSEDQAFCERATQDGFQIWLDPSIRLVHRGIYNYQLEDMDIFKEGKQLNQNIAVTKVMKV